MICSDLFASARKPVFPAPTATGVHRLRNTWSSLLSQPVASYASFSSRIQVHGKGPRKNKVGSTATGGSGCGGWRRRNLPQKKFKSPFWTKNFFIPPCVLHLRAWKTIQGFNCFFPIDYRVPASKTLEICYSRSVNVWSRPRSCRSLRMTYDYLTYQLTLWSYALRGFEISKLLCIC